MLRYEQQNTRLHRMAPNRTALIVHDGSAFALGQWFRNNGFDTSECPLIVVASTGYAVSDVAIVAVRELPQRGARVLQVIRKLCWDGIPVVAVGAASEALLTLFGDHEFYTVAPTADGVGLAKSHVFRQAHSLHEAVLDSAALRATLLPGLVQRLRPRNSRKES